MNLKQKTFNGVKWTSLSSIICATLQLLQVSILARYLEPSDFGVMAIVSSVIGFSALFMDMGISSAIIQKQNISHKQLSSLYWLNILSGGIIFLLVYFSAPIISNYYNYLDIAPLIQLLAITFLISAFGSQYKVLNQKKLLFNRLAIIQIIASTTSFIVAIYCVISGYGVYSLVYAMLGNVIVSNVIYIVKGIHDYKPAFFYRHHLVKKMMNFGLFQMGEKSIHYFNSQFDVIMIGKLLGAEALGVYSIAKTLAIKPIEIINPIVTKVTFPIMSTIQNDSKQLKNIYLKTISYLCSINFPIYITIAILAKPLVILLFGEDWFESIIILQILSLYFMLRSIGNPIGTLQLAKGRADLGFYWNTALLTVTPLCIYLGTFHNLTGVALSLLFLQFILMYPLWFFMIKSLSNISFFEYLVVIIKPLILTVIASFIGVVAKYFIGNVIFSSVVFIVLSLASYLILIRWFHKDLWFLIRDKI